MDGQGRAERGQPLVGLGPVSLDEVAHEADVAGAPRDDMQDFIESSQIELRDHAA